MGGRERKQSGNVAVVLKMLFSLNAFGVIAKTIAKLLSKVT